MGLNLVVYTGGTFDLFHAGHVKFLKRCKEIAGLEGLVVVSLNQDEFIKEYKGKPPVMSFDERREALESCRYVDQVISNGGGRDSRPSIESIMPDVIAIGSDWARKDYYAQMQFNQDWLDERSISLVYIPYTPGVSSSDIKSRIKNTE